MLEEASTWRRGQACGRQFELSRGRLPLRASAGVAAGLDAFGLYQDFERKTGLLVVDGHQGQLSEVGADNVNALGLLHSHDSGLCLPGDDSV